MSLNDNFQIRQKVNKMKTINSTLLLIVFIVMLTFSLLFCGGALLISFEYGGMMGSGWTSGISWMWLPALFFFTLSIIPGWEIFVKKNV
jgi:hypothetical protein